MPLVLGPDKKRLSKRHDATGLEEYQLEGYLDSAILNTLARLGWSKGDQEVFYMDDLIKNFNIDDIQKAGAVFDRSKLDWLNSQHLANLTLSEIKDHLRPYLIDLSIDIDNHLKVDLLIDAMRSSANTLKGIAEDLVPYYKNVTEYNENAVSKFIDEEGLKILKDLRLELSELELWDVESLDKILVDYQRDNNCPVPKVNQPIRIALTGSTKSPSLGLTLSLYEKEDAINRIDALISYIT